MKFKTVLLLLLTHFNIVCLNAQNSYENRISIRNYTAKEIGSSVVNWTLVQSQSGEIYTGNIVGLYQYDGTKWIKCLDLPTYSIAQNANGTIYIGSQGDFGYLSSSAKGSIEFHSLKKHLKPSFNFTSLVWDIELTSEGVYFSSKQGIFRWNGSEMKVWESLPNYEYSSRIIAQNGIVAYKANTGIVRLTEEGDDLIFNSNLLKSEIIFYLYENKNSLILGLKNNGLVSINDSNRLFDFKSKQNIFLNTHHIFTEFLKDKSDFLIGTHTGGIAVLDKNYDLLQIIDESNGLQNNAVRDIQFDQHQNLWCALQNGVSMIEFSSPWGLWNENSGLEGLPWLGIERFENELYVGTNKGLFYLENNKFQKIEVINSRVWSLTTIRQNNQNLLIAATDQGLLSISKNKKTKLIYNKNSTNVISSRLSPEKIILSSTEGIILISFDNTGYKQQMLMPFNNKDQVVPSSTEDHNGDIWIGARDLGVIKISEIESDQPTIKLFKESDGLSDLSSISFASMGSRMFIGNSDGLFEYHEKNSSFEKLNLITGAITILESVSDSSIYVAYNSATDQLQIEKITFKNATDVDRINTPYKRITGDDNSIRSIFSEKNQTWFGTNNGLYQFNENLSKDYTIPYNTLVRKVTSLDSLLFAGTYSKFIDSTRSVIVTDQPKSYQPALAYENNTIRFEYTATFYEVPERNEYSYYLEGNDKVWSNWSTENIKEYNNLSAGDYTFKVKSKNIYDLEGRMAIYKFKILAPWYQTAWAYGAFSLAGGLFIWFIVLAYSFRVREQRKKLTLIVADRTFEVLTQKKEIEKQNDLLKEQNEEIAQQRDDINEKNQELEMSQEEILSINEKLKELNTLLEKKVEKRTSKIKSTLRQLQQTNAELDTFIYRASHDLKGPISRIHGLTSLGKLESSSPNDIKYYDLIELVAKDMHKLLAKLTQVHEVIHSEIEKETIDLPVLITDVRNSIAFLDKNNDSKYAFELENTLQIKTDAFLFAIIITNLMENAVIFKKNTTNSTHQILIKSSQDDTNYYIQIKDTGLGVTDEHLSKLFNMFFRGSDQSKGSGLGLYLVRLAIDKLKGKITVESETGVFTSFVVTIPK